MTAANVGLDWEFAQATRKLIEQNLKIKNAYLKKDL
jgi:hypothetical protein